MLPERTELEYMLTQRKIVGQGGELDEMRLRVRLWQVAGEVARHSMAQVAAVFGRKVPEPRREILAAWVDLEVAATAAYLERLRNKDRQDADGEAFYRQLLRGQRESGASSAVLGLNADLIEEVARGAGSTHYRWITQRDGRVRDWHAKLDDRVLSWGSPPSGGGTRAGDKGHPGSGFGCRCFPEPFEGTQPSRKPLAPRPERPKPAPAASPGPVEFRPYQYRGPLEPSMALDKAEDAIQGLQVEHAMAWDEEGRALLRKTSKHSSKVEFNLDYVMAMVDRDVHTFTHNHPGGTAALSTNDIAFAALIQAKRFRAITVFGEGMELVVTDVKKWRNALELGAGLPGGRSVNLDLRFLLKRAIGDIEDGAHAYRETIGEYRDALQREAAKAYNKIGESYGFEIKTFD